MFLIVCQAKNYIFVEKIMFIYFISSLTNTLLLIVSAIFLGIFYFWDTIINYFRISHYCKGIPSPPSYPLIGNAYLAIDSNETIRIFTKWTKEMSKNYYFWYGAVIKFVITDPHDVEILMNSPYADEKDDIYEFLHPCSNDGLFSSKGVLYHAHKKVIMPFLNGKPLPGYVKEANQHSLRLIEIMEKKVGNDQFDIYPFLNACIGDLVFETIFGIPGKAQHGQLDVFVHQVEQIIHIIHKRMIYVWLYPDFIFKLSKLGKEFFGTLPRLDLFLQNIMVDKKEKYSKYHRLGIEDEPPKALFDHIINLMIKENIWTDAELRAELLTMFAASHDTMTGIGCFVALMLAMHPDMQERAREEIKSIVESDNIITYRDTLKMKYMDMVIRETVRLFPAAPILPRKITGDIKLTNFTLPKGSSAFMIPYATHFDPDHWFEPEKFNPERFTHENSRARHRYAFIGFSSGARSCPGQKYAIVLLKVVIGDFIRNYRLTTKTTMKTLRINMHVSTRTPDGWNISVDKLEKQL